MRTNRLAVSTSRTIIRPLVACILFVSCVSVRNLSWFHPPFMSSSSLQRFTQVLFAPSPDQLLHFIPNSLTLLCLSISVPCIVHQMCLTLYPQHHLRFFHHLTRYRILFQHCHFDRAPTFRSKITHGAMFLHVYSFHIALNVPTYSILNTV